MTKNDGKSDSLSVITSQELAAICPMSGRGRDRAIEAVSRRLFDMACSPDQPTIPAVLCRISYAVLCHLLSKPDQVSPKTHIVHHFEV